MEREGAYLCPLIVERQVDVERSHSLTVLSHEPVTRTLGSSGLKAREDTASPCPLRVDKHDPEVMSHVLMVVSWEALTTILGLSGLKATQFTPRLLKQNKLVLTKR